MVRQNIRHNDYGLTIIWVILYSQKLKLYMKDLGSNGCFVTLQTLLVVWATQGRT